MIQIGPLVIDFTPLLEAAAHSPLFAAWFVLKSGGWIVFFMVAFHYLYEWWTDDYMWDKCFEKWEWVLLAIEVPKENIQTPKAMENILAHLAGAHQTPDLFEKYWEGFAQEYFSLEIASIGGHVQYYIYTPKHMRDLVESAIYAQYTNAEISEAPDYTTDAPERFPDPNGYYCWGTEWKLVKHQAYPLRTYEAFQDETAEEAGFKDPMAALLETMGTLLPGEQLWFQIIVEPIEANSWQHASHAIINKMAGKKKQHSDKWFLKLLEIPIKLFGEIWGAFVGNEIEHEEKRDEPLSQVLYLTSGEAETIKAIEAKAEKIGFGIKIRGVYLSPKAISNKARGRYGLIGAIKQVNTENHNSLKPETKIVGTHAHYFFTDWRKNWKRGKIVRAYKHRSIWTGLGEFVLNIEEIATLWHFPVTESARAPLVRKAEVRRGEPPIQLPVDEGPFGHHEWAKSHGGLIKTKSRHGAPPEGIPSEEESSEGGMPGNLPV